DSGYAYIVGSTVAAGGLYMVDISNPQAPTYAGEFAAAGYTHDAQAVMYAGPDLDYAGREIVIGSNANNLSIIDVTDKSSPSLISQGTYEQSAYVHHGWFSDDHRYFFVNDEADEIVSTAGACNVVPITCGDGQTRTHVFDLQDLDDPNYVGFHTSDQISVDHNLYVHEGLIYQANYASGLRVLEATDPDNAVLTEVAWLDTYPQGDGLEPDGAWSVYPFFESGTILVSDITNGLIVARLESNPEPCDLSGDGRCDASDIDLLQSLGSLVDGVSAAGNERFDLNGDGQIDLLDRDQWLADAAVENGLDSPYKLGDANLDGVVDGQDFIDWNAAKFTADARWSRGDFNADGVIDGQDFLAWNANKFTSSDGVTVPEPRLVVVLTGLLCGLGCRPRRS
ncbi:MAG: choice-of-anchor B family protein, partial [Planctomycetota bacterium]